MGKGGGVCGRQGGVHPWAPCRARHCPACHTRTAGGTTAGLAQQGALSCSSFHRYGARAAALECSGAKRTLFGPRAATDRVRRRKRELLQRCRPDRLEHCCRAADCEKELFGYGAHKTDIFLEKNRYPQKIKTFRATLCVCATPALHKMAVLCFPTKRSFLVGRGGGAAAAAWRGLACDAAPPLFQRKGGGHVVNGAQHARIAAPDEEV